MHKLQRVAQGDQTNLTIVIQDTDCTNCKCSSCMSNQCNSLDCWCQSTFTAKSPDLIPNAHSQMRVNWICHFGDHTNLCNFHLNIYIQSALNSPDLMARCLDRKDMWRQKSLKCSFEPISPTSQYRDRKDSVTKKTLKCSFKQKFEEKISEKFIWTNFTNFQT